MSAFDDYETLEDIWITEKALGGAVPAWTSERISETDAGPTVIWRRESESVVRIPKILLDPVVVAVIFGAGVVMLGVCVGLAVGLVNR